MLRLCLLSFAVALVLGYLILRYEHLHRRFTGEGGTDFLLDLVEATVLRDGDGLLLEGGGVILVRAAPEPLVRSRSAAQ